MMAGEKTPDRGLWRISLKIRLALAAAMLGAAAMAAAGTLYFGMQAVSARLEAAIVAERRMAGYATLSTRVSTLLVIATEAVQTERPPEERTARVDTIAEDIALAFARLEADLQEAVVGAERLGLDQQSRFGTQSLGLARMAALLQRLLEDLQVEGAGQARLRASIDSFASSFDPLLNQAVNAEVVFRGQALASIEALRTRLAVVAVAMALASVLLAGGGYWWLVRPQFARLDRLRDAARQIGAANFSTGLPETQTDEIGQIYRETNRMAQALSQRRDAVDAEWQRLNEVIAQRTTELRAANARLEEVDANRRRFFADVSHELRTPLTVVLMEAQIGRRAASSPEMKEAFATIETRAERLNRRIDDLLRVARSDSGKLELDARAEPVEHLMAQIRDEISAEIASAGMTFHVPQVPKTDVVCDPNWLRQILVGLIRNALRHARSGGDIALDLQADGPEIRFVLRDNGPGIAEDHQEAVFQRFVQSSAVKSQGFGIGLALARWVVEEQGGRVALTSPVPRDRALGQNPGLEVTVTMPAAR